MIEFPENSCPLCDLKNIKSVFTESARRTRLYYCHNCGPYYLSFMAYGYSPIAVDPENKLRPIVSYYIRHHTSEEKPFFLDRDNVEEILKNTKLPSVSEQLDNLLKWFGDKSEYSLDTIDGNTKHLIALIGCKNQQQVINLLDQLWTDHFISMEVPTTGPLRERATFDLFAACLTKKGIDKLEEQKQNFLSSIISIELAFNSGESSSLEFKGSFKFDINRFLMGDGIKSFDNKIALDGVLRTLVAFLNSSGGNIFIGVLEKSKFPQEKIQLLKFTDYKTYYLIGIENESSDQDKYELDIRNLISSHIAKDITNLIEITFPSLEGFIFCQIYIKQTNQKWYYLDNKFFVREGNRSILLEGEAADLYKQRNKRGT